MIRPLLLPPTPLLIHFDLVLPATPVTWLTLAFLNGTRLHLTTPTHTTGTAIITDTHATISCNGHQTSSPHHARPTRLALAIAPPLPHSTIAIAALPNNQLQKPRTTTLHL
ncbi:MAG: hypothetical protein D6790_14990 [Caldilineae bacterium]|nr:MAG: hypothetical protein D6790_14990 [Caldilineae bacterium]